MEESGSRSEGGSSRLGLRGHGGLEDGRGHWRLGIKPVPLLYRLRGEKRSGELS